MAHSCCVPNCVNAEDEQAIQERCFFTIKRPEFAKIPVEKKHRQDLTDIILRVCTAEKLEFVKDQLHRERIQYCDRHFFDGDIELKNNKAKLKLGALPVLNMPFHTAKMRERLEERNEAMKRVFERYNEDNAEKIPLPKRQKPSKSNQNSMVTFLTLNEAIKSDVVRLVQMETQEVPQTKHIKEGDKRTDITESKCDNIVAEIKCEILDDGDVDGFRFYDNSNISSNPCYEIEEFNDYSKSDEDISCDFHQQHKLNSGDGMDTSATQTTNKQENLSLAQQMWDLIVKMRKFCIKTYKIIDEANLVDDDGIKVEFVSISSKIDYVGSMYNEQNSLSSSLDASETDKEVKQEYKKTNYEDLFQSTVPSSFWNVVNIPQVDELKPKRSLKIGSAKRNYLLPPKTRLTNAGEIIEMSIDELTKKSLDVNNSCAVKKRKKIKLKKLMDTGGEFKSNKPKVIDGAVKKRRGVGSEYYQQFEVEHPDWRHAFKCQFCHRLFKEWYTLKQHDMDTHTGVRLKQCKVCGKNYKFMDMHMLVHTKERKFECKICNAKFLQRAHLTTHESQLTACVLPNYECKMCHEQLCSEENCAEHVHMKHPDSICNCNVCEGVISEKSATDMHQFTLLKLYKCKYCDESFTFRKEYRNHLKTAHAEEVDADEFCCWKKCPKCLLFCTSRYQFKSHLLSHEAPPTFLCEYCSKTFASKRTLKKHAARQHKEFVE